MASADKRDKGTVQSYLDKINKCSLLTHEQMTETFKRLEAGDNKAKDELTIANLRLVVSIAKSYRCHGIPIEDLIQEGNIGLMKSIDRFIWQKGFRFSTYATWWIRQAMGQLVLKRKTMIRLPAHAVTVQRKLSLASEEFRKKFGTCPTTEELIEATNCSPTVAKATVNCGKMISLQDFPKHGASSGSEYERTWEHIIPDDRPGVDPYDNVCCHELLNITKEVLSRLSVKEAAILRLRFGLCEDTDNGSFVVSHVELTDIIKGYGMK